jgi:sulfate transport system ATP-binding protein/putative spermidine/putrescine transport system ATP-binding protein
MSLVENLHREYSDSIGGDFTVHIPRWEISDEGTTAVWGPSGSGKTSIFRLLIGLEECPGLKWIFKGEDLASLPVPERRLGVVFQTLELFPHLTALENIKFAAKARRLSASELKASLVRLTDLLQLESFQNRQTHLLSGGERQRVAIARALIGKPRFLFLDEPFSAIDEDLREEARKLVELVILEQKIPTLLITHDRRDVDRLAQHVVHIKEGKVVSSE